LLVTPPAPTWLPATAVMSNTAPAVLIVIELTLIGAVEDAFSETV
jgi:hypothetical protein